MAGIHRTSQPKDYGIMARLDDGFAGLQCAALPPFGTYSVSFWFSAKPAGIICFLFSGFSFGKMI